MLTIVVPGVEAFNEETEEFETIGDFTLELEHSLVSLSKWEEKHEKPFLGTKDFTAEEMFDYIKCMVLTEDVPEDVYGRFTEKNAMDINDYINKKMTATWFSDKPGRTSRETITAELIYFWLNSFQIPWDAQYWHLNKLFTVIRIHSAKSNPDKKMTRAERFAEQRRLNEQRRAAANSKG